MKTQFSRKVPLWSSPKVSLEFRKPEFRKPISSAHLDGEKDIYRAHSKVKDQQCNVKVYRSNVPSAWVRSSTRDCLRDTLKGGSKQASNLVHALCIGTVVASRGRRVVGFEQVCSADFWSPCRTTTWKSRTWSGTMKFKLSLIPVPAATSSRLLRSVSVARREFPAWFSGV